MPQQFIPSSMPINGGGHNNNSHNRSSISSSSNNSLGSMSMKKSKKDKPSTRVRTVLSESQLRILKQMYTQNSRPDAVTKDHLVEATGLSARVIRVWFQNKRCKDKKRQTAMKEAQRTMEKVCFFLSFFLSSS
uniref:Homeobox domain-containing protein n=1 Tax=Panagrolaimus superbus TaxID=310955 RepID=A0A914YED8_9BILA